MTASLHGPDERCVCGHVARDHADRCGRCACGKFVWIGPSAGMIAAAPRLGGSSAAIDVLPTTTAPAPRRVRTHGRGAKEPPIVVELRPSMPKPKKRAKKRAKKPDKSISDLLDDALSIVDRGDELAERLHALSDRLRALWPR